MIATVLYRLGFLRIKKRFDLSQPSNVWWKMAYDPSDSDLPTKWLFWLCSHLSFYPQNSLISSFISVGVHPLTDTRDEPFRHFCWRNWPHVPNVYSIPGTNMYIEISYFICCWFEIGILYMFIWGLFSL